MDLFVKIVSFFGLIGHLNLVSSTAMLSTSTSSPSQSSQLNTSKITYFTGLLSDILYTNRVNDLSITPLCDQQLSDIQNSLDLRDIWAIKCKLFDFWTLSEQQKY